MNKKVISIVAIIIAVLFFVYAVVMGFSNSREICNFSLKMDQIQQKQDGFSSELKNISESLPKNDQNSDSGIKNWKTYSDGKYGYSIKYPEELLVLSAKEFDSSDKEINVLELATLKTDKGDLLGVRVCSNPVQLNLDNFYSEFLKKFSPDHADDSSRLEKNQISTNGFNGFEFIDSGGDGNYRYIVLKGKNQKFIYIVDYPLYTTDKTDSENNSMRNLFDKIFFTLSEI